MREKLGVGYGEAVALVEVKKKLRFPKQNTDTLE